MGQVHVHSFMISSTYTVHPWKEQLIDIQEGDWNLKSDKTHTTKFYQRIASKWKGTKKRQSGNKTMIFIALPLQSWNLDCKLLGARTYPFGLCYFAPCNACWRCYINTKINNRSLVRTFFFSACWWRRTTWELLPISYLVIWECPPAACSGRDPLPWHNRPKALWILTRPSSCRWWWCSRKSPPSH